MKVCIFVLNDCTVDSRILREAATFAAAGHETIIVAVHRNDVPFVESRDGFQIRRVPTKLTWVDAYPRLIGWPARLLRIGVRSYDLDALNAAQAEAQAEREPVTTVEEELAQDESPNAFASDMSEGSERDGEVTQAPSGQRLSPEQWVAWVRTGSPPHPRSWTGGEASSRRDRLKHMWTVSAGSPIFIGRRAYRLTRTKVRRYRRRFKRWRRDVRVLTGRRFTLPTRFRQLDRRMAAEAIRFRADLYWANDVTTIRSAYAAARATKGRVVYDAHEVIWDAPTVTPFHRRLWGEVERRHVKKVHRVSTVCEPIADEMAGRYGIERPVVILNCPRLTDTRNAGRPEDSPLNEFRRPGEKIVLFHGSLSAWRGLEQMLQAFTLLPDGYRLVILGHGVFRLKLEEMTEELGVGERVTFLHSVPPAVLPGWLVGADLGVIPYQRVGLNHEYSTPNKLFEYMHVGVPLLVNELPEVQRIVTEVGYGTVVDCSDPASIAKGIQDMLSEPERLSEMSRNARSAAPRYSWESQEQKILDALP